MDGESCACMSINGRDICVSTLLCESAIIPLTVALL